MYLEHFGLGVNPFSLSPKLDFLYKSGTFEESMAHLVYGLDNHEAIVLITGSIGTGKTMALQSFLSNLGPRFEFALITNTRVTAIELLKLVLEDLGVDLPAGADKSDLLILFKDYMVKASQEGKMILIVVDEAQNLPPEVLEEIRLLTNLGQGETQPVQIILVGQPELEDTVNRPDLAQIRQRIRVHYTLDPLDRQETEEYINHRMAVAGCGREVFTTGAVERIFQGSRGVPRLVNTLAGEALLSAFVAGHEMVQPIDVEEDQDLRFTTGPAPLPGAVAPAPVAPQLMAPPPPPPPPTPAPAPTPELMQQPPPVPDDPDGSRPADGLGRALRPWLIAAVVVLILGALYNFGFLDGVLDALNRDSRRVAEPVQTGQTVAAVQDPVGEEEVPSEVVSEPAKATEPEDQEIPPTVVEEKPPVVVPEMTRVEETQPEPEDQKEADPAPARRDVPVQAVTNPAPATTVEVEGPLGTIDYYIHIYSFRTPERAESYVRNWAGSADSISTRIQEIRGVNWHRVYVGPYPTRATALGNALRLEGEGLIDYFKVVQLR